VSIIPDLSSLQGFDSMGESERACLGKYFNFLLLNVHFVILVLNTAWDSSSGFFSNPVGWSEAISISIPSGSAFFINYLILNIILLPVELLRPIPIIYYMFSRWFLSTPREYYELGLATSTIRYGNEDIIQHLPFQFRSYYSASCSAIPLFHR
jgi:calcium permeable stress-gated cation channel